MTRHTLSATLAIGALLSVAAFAQSTAPAGTLGTVRLGRAVMANGQPLAAGTYQLRLSTEALKAAVGESPGSEQWIEFVKGGAVAGKEVATVISSADIGAVAKGPRPSAGAPRVEELQGGDYVRIWIVRSGTNYLINLRSAPK
jgi:hypothetical protein